MAGLPAGSDALRVDRLAKPGERSLPPHNRPMPFDLERFVAAQEGVYEGALRELRAGRKTGH